MDTEEDGPTAFDAEASTIVETEVTETETETTEETEKLLLQQLLLDEVAGEEHERTNIELRSKIVDKFFFLLEVPKIDNDDSTNLDDENWWWYGPWLLKEVLLADGPSQDKTMAGSYISTMKLLNMN